MQTSEKSYRFLCREACPACGSKDFSILYSAPLDSGSIGRFIEDYYAIDPRLLGGAPYELCECASCKLIYQRYVGSNKLLEALYTDWVSEPLDPEQEIAAYRDEIGAVAQSRDGHEIMVASSFTGVPLKHMRVLDYGMGWALWARIARQLGCQAFGIDVAEPRMLYASRHGITTLREDQLEGREFHFINMEQVLEHVVDPLALVITTGRVQASQRWSNVSRAT